MDKEAVVWSLRVSLSLMCYWMSCSLYNTKQQFLKLVGWHVKEEKLSTLDGKMRRGMGRAKLSPFSIQFWTLGLMQSLNIDLCTGDEQAKKLQPTLNKTVWAVWIEELTVTDRWNTVGGDQILRKTIPLSPLHPQYPSPLLNSLSLLPPLPLSFTFQPLSSES